LKKSQISDTLTNKVYQKHFKLSSIFSSHEPVDVADHGWEGVKEEGGELVERVEDKGVSPDDDCETNWPHT